MKRSFILAAVILSAASALGVLVQVRKNDLGWDAAKSQYKLYNGWFLSPVGKRVTLNGDMPGSIVLSTDGRYILVGTHGYNDHSLTVIDRQTQEITDSKKVDRSSFGLAVVGDTVYSSGGRSAGTAALPDIRRWRIHDGKLTELEPLNLPNLAADQRFVTSIVADRDRLYVANAQSDEILRLDPSGAVQRRVKVGYRPRMIAVAPDGLTLAVSEWGDKGVVLLDAETLATRERFSTLPHPTAILYHPDGRLFVAESGSNTIVQIRDHALIRTTVSIDRSHPVGPTPTGLALSPDGKRLFVTLAGENSVASLAIDGDRPIVQGHIPTERWPSAVAVSPDGKTLMVATAKGFYGPSELEGKPLPGADGAKAQMTARVAFLDMPSADSLKHFSTMARKDLPEGIGAAHLSRGQIAEAMRNLGGIKHVIYVIKENKTFDQVLGDLSGANGDPSVTVFGERVTTNQHALAQRFVVLDNLYSDAEASQVGHQWADSAYASEYTESQWSSNYGGKGELDSDDRLTSSPGDYLWSAARKQGLWARVYGEYVDVQEDHGSLKSPEKKANPERWGYSEPWERVFAGGGRDTEKLATFLVELKGFEQTGKMPSLMVMALPDDHTHGYSAGSYSPKAMVGDNDLAVGRLVEAISHSRFWKDTAIFVIQDDTQGGLDHVDSHRTYGFVFSPYSQSHSVDSTHYTTASMLLTMEKILGLPPMSSYDANATPMLRPFLGKPNFATFRAVPPCAEINDKNPDKTELAAETSRLDWSDIDRADPDGVSRLLWKGERPGVPYPGGPILKR